MLKIDDNLLNEIGLGDLPLEEKDLLLSEIYQQLELRVGTKLADAMSEEQLTEFEKFMNTEDEKGALKWLQTNFPDYPKVVAAELEGLKKELKEQSFQIKQTIQQQPASNPPPTTPGAQSPVTDQPPGPTPGQSPPPAQ